MTKEDILRLRDTAEQTKVQFKERVTRDNKYDVDCKIKEQKRYKYMDKDLLTTGKRLMQTEDSEYVRLVSLISGVWDKAREKAALAVNTELLDASWETGRYIVEYEQHGNVKAEYGKQLLTNLSKDLTRLCGKGYSRSNLFNMRLFYVRFPKIQTCLDN